MYARVAGPRLDRHAAHGIDSRTENVVSGRGDGLVTFAVALGSVAAMAAVTDMRSAPEAHHDKEQCGEEQERKKAAHGAIPGPDMNCGPLCALSALNPLRRNPHGLRVQTQYDSAGSHLTTLCYCHLERRKWRMSKSRKHGERLTSRRPQQNRSWHRRRREKMIPRRCMEWVLEQDPTTFRAMRQVMCIRGASWIPVIHIQVMRPFDCDKTSCGFRATRCRGAGARPHGSRMRNARVAALSAPLSHGSPSHFSCSCGVRPISHGP